jgi:hypothetical protein
MFPLIRTTGRLRHHWRHHENCARSSPVTYTSLSYSPLLAFGNLALAPNLAASKADDFAPAVLPMYGNIVRVSCGEPIPEEGFGVDCLPSAPLIP